MEKMEIPEYIEKIANKVEGKNDSKDMMAFTLSTCQWCKKFKRYMKDRDVSFKYVDVDQIDPSEKAQILTFLRNNFDERVSYPYLICDGNVVVGYNPNKYDELLKD
ncbi:MAG: glutaredoxin family protein [Promethearchaeati archaeon]